MYESIHENGISIKNIRNNVKLVDIILTNGKMGEKKKTENSEKCFIQKKAIQKTGRLNPHRLKNI